MSAPFIAISGVPLLTSSIAICLIQIGIMLIRVVVDVVRVRGLRCSFRIDQGKRSKGEFIWNLRLERREER